MHLQIQIRQWLLLSGGMGVLQDWLQMVTPDTCGPKTASLLCCSLLSQPLALGRRLKADGMQSPLLQHGATQQQASPKN